jgi:hypothetical protein
MLNALPQWMDHNEYALAHGFADDASCAWPSGIDALLKLAVKADAYLFLAEVRSRSVAQRLCWALLPWAWQCACARHIAESLHAPAGAWQHLHAAAPAQQPRRNPAHWPWPAQFSCRAAG